MFTKRLLFTLIFVLCVLLAACTPAAAPAPTDPVSIVKMYYNGINTNDIDHAMTFADDDLVLTDPSGVIAGKEQIAAYWKDLVAAGFKFELSDLKAVGGRVTSCFKVSQNDQLLDQGCTGVTHVRDGKIVFDGLEMAEGQYIIEQYYAALNAKDIDLAMSYIAPDAEFANPTGKYTTTEEIRASLDGLAKDGITFELSNFRAADGRVVYDYKVLLGEDVLDSGTDGLTIVQNGLITFDGTERTEAQVPTPEVAFTASDSAFGGPAEIEGGWVKLVLTNEGQEPHHIQLVKLFEDKTPDDLKTALAADPENFPAWSEPYGGPNAPDPGGTTSAIVFLDAGSYALIDVIPNAEGVPHFLTGLMAALTVTEPTGSMSGEPLADITINLTEFAFLVSGELTPGEHIIRFNNAGKQVHEAVLVMLQEGKTADDYLNTPPGEMPPAISLGGITGINSGDGQYIPVTLEAGEYALFCFFPDPASHAPHFVQGMILQFTVK